MPVQRNRRWSVGTGKKKMTKVKGLVGAGGASLILVFILSWVFLPEETILRYLQSSLPYGLEAEFVDFHKDFFYRIRSALVLVRRGGKPLLSIEELEGRVDLPSLLLLKPLLIFRGKMGRGSIQARFSPRMGKRWADLDLRFDRLPLQGFSPLASWGIIARGLIEGEGHFAGGRGVLRIRMRDLKLQGESPWAAAIPLESFAEGSGALNLNELEGPAFSLSIEGKDIYATLHGASKEGKVELTLELMPTSSLIRGKPLQFLLLDRYKIAPGYYVINFSGDLSPQLFVFPSSPPPVCPPR